jgi:hypothetical protein
VGILFSICYLDALVWWKVDTDLLLIIDDLGRSPRGRLLLGLLLLVNAWVLDRHLTARIPAGLCEVRWLHATRMIIASAPLIGLAVIPLWQRLVRSVPAWAFVPCTPASPLVLEGRHPARFGNVRENADVWLKSWSQRQSLQILWLVGCQIAPLFSGLHLLFQQSPKAAVVFSIVLHLAGAAVALAHVELRKGNLQMTGGRAAWFRLLPLILLLPPPFSVPAILIWLPATEERREGKGVILTLYESQNVRRHPFASVRAPRPGEIIGDREEGRHRAAAAKVMFLALESAVLAGIAARTAFPLLPNLESLLVLLLILSAFPGVCLLLAGGVARHIRQWPQLTSLTDHPYGVFLTMVPLALVLGMLVGTTESKDQPILLFALGLAGVLMTLLVIIWNVLLSAFSGALVPERRYTGMALWLLFSALVIVLTILQSYRTALYPLAAVLALASSLCGFIIASRWLAPFQLRDLLDQRLPGRLRAVLWGLALTALLPLGGLAVPIWIRLRHRCGPDLDRWAARLREPRA